MEELTLEEVEVFRVCLHVLKYCTGTHFCHYNVCVFVLFVSFSPKLQLKP